MGVTHFSNDVSGHLPALDLAVYGLLKACSVNVSMVFEGKTAPVRPEHALGDRNIMSFVL